MPPETPRPARPVLDRVKVALRDAARHGEPPLTRDALAARIPDATEDALLTAVAVLRKNGMALEDAQGIRWVAPFHDTRWPGSGAAT